MKLFYKFAIFAAIISYSNAWSQITFLEDFETSPGWDDPDGWYYLDMPFESCSDMVYITFLYSDYAGYEETAVSPMIGVSSGGVATLTYDYKLVQYNNPSIALENDPSWGSVKVEYATSDEGPWTVIDNITPENHLVSTSCATRTAQFTPEAGSNVYLRLNVQVDDSSAGVDALVYLDNVAVSQAGLCETEAPDLTTTQAVCSNANIGDLDTGDYATIIWYAGAAGGTPLASNVTLIDGGIYYAANFEECESVERTAVTITINSVEEPEAAATQSFCASATVSDLQVEDDGAMVSWYAAETGGAPLSGTAVLTGGNTYYVSQTVNGCESADRTAVTVIINTTEEPEAAATQSFCASATVSDLQVEDDGAMVSWYAAETGGAPLSGTAALTGGNTYYVSQTVNGCESSRTPVAVIITTVLEPVVESPQVFTENVVLNDIVITATGAIAWYATEEDALTGENALPETTTVTQSGTYYVTQSVSGCESDPAMVVIDIVLGIESFEEFSVAIYPNPVSDILTISSDMPMDSVIVYNLIGQEMLHKTVLQYEQTIDVSALSSGTYLLEVRAGEKISRSKIIKR